MRRMASKTSFFYLPLSFGTSENTFWARFDPRFDPKYPLFLTLFLRLLKRDRAARTPNQRPSASEKLPGIFWALLRGYRVEGIGFRVRGYSK